RKGHETRVHRQPVDQDRAGAAFSFAASFFRSRELTLFAQHVEEALHRMRIDSHGPAVQREAHHEATRSARMMRSGVAGISRTSKPACLRALIAAGAGPSIGISPTPLAPNGPCSYGFSRTTTSIGGKSSVVGMM